MEILGQLTESVCLRAAQVHVRAMQNGASFAHAAADGRDYCGTKTFNHRAQKIRCQKNSGLCAISA
jgi:hypothetical protein